MSLYELTILWYFLDTSLSNYLINFILKVFLYCKLGYDFSELYLKYYWHDNVYFVFNIHSNYAVKRFNCSRCTKLSYNYEYSKCV